MASFAIAASAAKSGAVMLQYNVPPARELLSINDAMEVLGICKNSVRKLIAEGDLKATKLLGRVVIPRSEMDRFLAKLAASPE